MGPALGVANRLDCRETPFTYMSPDSSDDLLLLIRCPSCGQRFKVEEDLRDKMVECGGCDVRFRINDDVIVRGRRFYPGERSTPALSRFQRVPLAFTPLAKEYQAMRYAKAPDASILEPASPLQILAGIIGISGMIMIALLLIFGANLGGSLDGMSMENRLVMAGFASFMGIVFLIYANPKARLKALGIGLLLSSGLLVIPFVFTAGSTIQEARVEPTSTPVPPLPTLESMKEDANTVLRNRIGTDPLDKEIKRLEAEGSPKHAIGLWLRGLSDMNRFLVRDYIFRVTGADPSSHFYPRDGGDFLMVVTGPKQKLDELTDVISPLGILEKIYPELSVIEIRVNNENFTEGSIKKLTEKDDPAYYELNKRELESVDLERVRRAVQRLAESPPKVYRVDITRKLISLLKEDGIDFKGNICHALSIWSDQPGPAGEAALLAVKKLMDKEALVPQEMIALIVKEKNLEVIPVLDQLWSKDPTTWESLFADLGPAIEASVIDRFPKTDGPARYSAVRLLGRVGGAASVPVLSGASLGANPELKVLLEQAQKAIHERLTR